MEYDNKNKGVLFTNDQGGNPKRPSLRGSLDVNGVDYNISGWHRESKKDGKPFLSLSVELKGESKFAPPKTAPVAQDLDNLDDFKF
jgi:hypothetical protein